MAQTYTLNGLTAVVYGKNGDERAFFCNVSPAQKEKAIKNFIAASAGVVLGENLAYDEALSSFCIEAMERGQFENVA